MSNLFYKVFIALAILLMLIPTVNAHTATASNTIQYQDNTAITTFEQSYVYGKQLTVLENYQGSMRVCFDLQGGYDVDADVYTVGYARIYLNGIAYGTQRSVTGYGYQSFCEDFTGLNLNAGDDWQIYYHGNQWFEASISNFKVKFDATPDTPESPPTPTLGLVIDTISVQHVTSLCKPLPVDYYAPGTLPETYGCSDTQRFYLDQYEPNLLPSGGASQRISASEMMLLYAKMIDYPGVGYINLSFYNNDTHTRLYSYQSDLTACGGNCNWANWYWWNFGYIGRFNWEINSPGNYNASVVTPWGSAVYNFVVESTSPFKIRDMFAMNMGNKIEVDTYTDGSGSYDLFLDNTLIQNVIVEGYNHLSIRNITSSLGTHEVCAYSVTNASNNICRSVAVTAPTPTPTPPPMSNGWSVSGHRDGDNFAVSACSSNALGYFYMISPTNQTKYATYINANTCNNFTLPVSDMIVSGGEGIWSLTIFDNTDLSASKAFYQYMIENTIVLTFNSIPLMANVYLNGNYTCYTPCSSEINAGDLNINITKPGYADYMITGHYTTSTAINANLVPLVNGNTPQPTPTSAPNTNPGVVDFNAGINGAGNIITGLNDVFSEGTKLLLACLAIIAGLISYGMAGLIGGFVISAVLGWLPLWIVLSAVMLFLGYVFISKGGDSHGE